MPTKTSSLPRREARSTQKSQKLWEEREKYVPRGLFHYTHLFIDSAEGATLRDVDGNSYIDFAGGIGTLNVGHRHPKVLNAVKNQINRFFHSCFHVLPYESYVRLCQKLCQITPGKFSKKAVLFNSGAEAVENAVKLARHYTQRPAVIAFNLSFHGRTLLALSLTGKERPYKTGFHPFVPEIYHAPYPYPYRTPMGIPQDRAGSYCLEILNRIFETQVDPKRVAAILVEPVLGEGGFVVPTPDFLPALRQVCDQHGILLIADEIQTGFGRTGRMFGCENYDVVPDLVTMAKSLGAGFPLSALCGRAEILDSPEVGGLGGTYGGNPVACEAALAVLDVFEKDRLVERGQKIGTRIRERFEKFFSRFEFIGEVRGLGAMQALELVKSRKTKEPLPSVESKKILTSCAEKGLILLKAGLYDNVLRTLVPLTIADQELDQGLDILESALAETAESIGKIETRSPGHEHGAAGGIGR